jgi:excisionase family DNA binding protein
MLVQQQSPPSDFSVKNLAQKCGVTERHVWDLIAEGQIPSYKVGTSVRIPAEAVEMLRSGQPVADDLDAQIKRIVDRAPKLSAAQRDTLAALLADDDV